MKLAWQQDSVNRYCLNATIGQVLVPKVQHHRPLRLLPQLRKAPLQDPLVILGEPMALKPELWRLPLRVVLDQLELDLDRGQEPDPE